jgi:AbrB family looped-hinge helix DNA binding protein
MKLDMLEEEMTVGPKGQVVIPRAMRKALKIQPGSKVVFRLEDNRAVVEKQSSDSVGILEGVARRGKSVRRISPHEYELELTQRA